MSADRRTGATGPDADPTIDPMIDPWARLARLTPARIGLGRAGSGLPTREVLRFGLAHAQARDAVHTPLDAGAVSAGILLHRPAPEGPDGSGVQVLIAHMGGPFWAAKDAGAWSIPKGEVEPGESALDVALREFEEELGTPAPVVAALNAAVVGAVETPAVARRMAAAGVDGEAGTPEALGAFIAAERAKWGRVVRDARIAVE